MPSKQTHAVRYREGTQPAETDNTRTADAHSPPPKKSNMKPRAQHTTPAHSNSPHIDCETMNSDSTQKSAENIATISLYDYSGQKILENNPSNREVKIDIEHLQNGLYFVKSINSLNETTVEKIIIQH